MKVQKILGLVLLFLIMIPQIESQLQSGNHELNAKYVPPNRRRRKKTQTGGFGILSGFVVGPILFVLSFAGTWFNQKRAAINYKRLKLAQSLLRKQPTQYELASNLESKLHSQKRLVHRIGNSQIIQPARDQLCLVFPYDAIVVQRKVEVKQLRATTKQVSRDEQQVQYHLQWATYNQQNCQGQANSRTSWFINNEKFYARQVRVCNYFLTESQMQKLQCETVIIPQPQTINAISNIAVNTGNPGQPIIVDNFIYFPAQNGDVQSKGSLRVKFYYCKSTQLSIISSVDDYKQTYQPFRIDLVDNQGEQDEAPCQQNACCLLCSRLGQMLLPISQINLIMKGHYQYKEMIKITIKKAMTQTCLLRLICFLAMVFGLVLFFSPVTQLLGYIPLVGGFLKQTGILIIGFGALLVCLPLFGIAFGVSWLRYHPMIGGPVLGSAIVILIAFSLIKT